VLFDFHSRRLCMSRRLSSNRADDLSFHGIRKAEAVWWNLSVSALVEQSVRRREGHLAATGPLVVRTGEYTGRSPNDRFFVREPGSEGAIFWGKINRPFDAEKYESLRARLFAYLEGRELFVQECHVGADEGHRLPIRIITEMAWHSLFARNMFIPVTDREALLRHVPGFTVISAPGFHSRPEMDGTRSEVFILIHFGRKEVLIGGSLYAGEIKKSIFTVMNYLLPPKGVLPMHCAASYGRDDRDVAVLFGLSGTGKTTLSADPERTLVGDDEHGWSDRGVFNFEGGCYAKVIKLSPEMEPEIHRTTGMFGTILENVGMDTESRRIDLDDATLTENTRASYPLSSIPRVSTDGAVGHPKHIVMLTADAFGVLPPISAMTTDQAMYHFLSGYTAKVAGTERGVVAPQATFSACFGAPFMALHPSIYARLLGEKVAAHKAKVWLLNTGWTGGPYGKGHRMSIDHTRAMLRAALSGKLDGVEMREDPVFGLRIPASCPGVQPGVLDPRSTWKDRAAYDETARMLAGMFDENFAQYAGQVEPQVRAAGVRKPG
ncbi:MAG TPA: phosphoenolpyruvate carboxykinase (ATP), partial [Candidatus Limnocylindrales bacterium]|nr:phosphoenolpyruvate carboxykinase (ATP) [Candidatus Limnocylindrales bacterium]